MCKSSFSSVFISIMLFLFCVLTTPADTFAANRSFTAYFGDNNTTHWDFTTTNGTGGSVTANGSNISNGSTLTFTSDNNTIVVTPDTANSYQIKSIYYIRTNDNYWSIGNWSQVPVSNPSSAVSFNINTNSNHNRAWYIWVVFEKVAPTYTVTGNIIIDASGTCDTTGNISPAVRSNINPNDTTTFTITNSDSACVIDAIDFNNAGFSTSGLSGSTYTTPPITGNSAFDVRFKKNAFTITVTNDPTGDTACGSITPTTQSYVTGTTVIHTIIKNSNCAISSVRVVDTNKGYTTATDVTASVVANSNQYTFTNIQADGSIVVKFNLVSTTLGGEYCQVPPFIVGQTALKPNVLIVFDTSGSMSESAYKNNQTYTCTTTSNLSTNPCSMFYGYFDNTKMYKVDTSNTNKYLIDSTATLNLSSSNGKSGNYLNYNNMRKVDIIRKILVGGQVNTTAGVSRTATGTKFLSTDSGKYVEYGTTEPTGLIHSVYDKVRFGMMVFNSNYNYIGAGDGGYVSAPLGSSLATMVAQVESDDTDPDGYTPLAETLYEAVRYYESKPSAYNSGTDYGNPTTNDPVQYSCQKHFVLMITDGEPTNDRNIPGYTGATVTDTAFSSWYTGLATADRPTSLMARVSYYAHTNDLRSASVGRTNMSGTQNITFYNVYTFGDGSGTATLQEAAKFGAFIDSNSNNKPDLATEYTTSGKIDGYYEASDGSVLEKNIEEALSKIISSTSSGTAAAVANNKSGERGANMIQALFYPQWPNDNSIKWLGEVQALWYYLDPIISSSGIYEDSDSNSELDITVDKFPPSDPFLTKSLWRAGGELQQMSSANRKIYTLLNAAQTLTATANTFSTTNTTTLKPLLNVSLLTDTQAGVLINYIRGTDNTLYRPRVVKFVDPVSGASTTDVWKLGDIINSTPQVQSATAINDYKNAYDDYSYDQFIKSTNYKARNVVFTGSNDGMLHAFRLGNVTRITEPTQPFRIAKIAGTDMGTEEWSFIPKNALPYLQNQAGTEYCHQYLVDGAPVIVDAAINKHADCTAANYWECKKQTTLTSANALDTTKTSWQTVVIGSMGLGGATRDMNSNCNETYSPDASTANNKDCVKTPVANNGLSSYFALDVSDPLTPKYMWEFSDYSISAATDKGLGFTTPGAAIVRIATSPQKVDKSKNGRWFAVFASGPTGELDYANRWFSGHSDQNLKLYIVDLGGGSNFIKCTTKGQTGCNYWVKDTGMPFAFANSLSSSAIDLDRWSSDNDGNYSDSVVYVTYTKSSLTSGYPSSSTAWDKGGVMRLVTNHDPDPFNWFTSALIDDIGPITTSIGRIQDRGKSKLWVYFGEGRFFYPGDSLGTTQKLYGVMDPCYKEYKDSANVPSNPLYAGDGYSKYAMGNSAANCPAVDKSLLQDQSGDTPSKTLASGKVGWKIDLAGSTTASGGTSGAERVVSDVTASFNGLVFYTTFIPNSDVCVPGGSTSLWAAQYNTGGTPAPGSLKGKAPIQTSSGGISLIDLSTAFTQKGGRKLDASLQPVGMAPKGRFPPLLSPKASRQIIQILER